MENKVDMLIHFDKQVFPLGTLWLRSGAGRESASFEYSDIWLKYPGKFSMAPSTPLTRGSFHTGSGRKIFSFLTDCMPDRWGRTILLRKERRYAKDIGKPPRTFTEGDFLLAVNDFARQGALQFSGTGSDDSDKQAVPSVLFLGKLLSASSKLQEGIESDEELQLLLAPGSSLGGARPKATVLDTKGKLWLAKFPSPQDHWDVPLWEYVSLKLAHEAGLKTPPFRLKKVAGKNVLLTQRFDRDGVTRLPFASAMTLLDLQDGEQGSYIEIAEILRADGSQPFGDIKELWIRMVFNAMISNVDDHLRNHAFLRESSGWRLSPVYDLEATPQEYKAHYQHTPIFPQNNLHLDMVFDEALSASKEFGLNLNEAKTVMQRLSGIIGQWSSIARAASANKTEIEIMESTFRTRIPADVAKT